ncbi:cytochrome P450 [Streptomyces sp. 3211]|uniref:cytochrome P450 n=1 Tax=Streptomyces sp. 3211 TaxID=1964449 RepID=UPI0013313733|nr:cytochrome P450 [Streptomyces sp. 3211]
MTFFEVERQCPAGNHETLLNATNPNFMANIFSAYDATRSTNPVSHVESLNLWVVTGREEIVSILRNDVDFSTRHNFDSDHELDDACLELLRKSEYFTPALLAMDPPRHTAVRGILTAEFTPKKMKALEARLRSLIDTFMDGLEEENEVDLIQGLTYPMPMRVIGDLIGIPEGDLTRIKKWHDRWMSLLVTPMNREDQLQCATALIEYDSYYRELIRRRLGAPEDDLASRFADAISGGICSESEAIAALRFFVAAGHETAMNTIANIIYALLLNREQWERLVKDRSLLAAAVEEGLRFDSGAQGTTRYALRETAWGDTVIPAGARIHLMTGAPGRDPEWVERASTFDIARRERGKHHAFGYGIHFCLGAPLARLESILVLDVLTTRYPSLRLSGEFTPKYAPGGYMLRGMTCLPVVLS